MFLLNEAPVCVFIVTHNLLLSGNFRVRSRRNGITIHIGIPPFGMTLPS